MAIELTRLTSLTEIIDNMRVNFTTLANQMRFITAAAENATDANNISKLKDEFDKLVQAAQQATAFTQDDLETFLNEKAHMKYNAARNTKAREHMRTLRAKRKREAANNLDSAPIISFEEVDTLGFTYEQFVAEITTQWDALEDSMAYITLDDICENVSSPELFVRSVFIPRMIAELKLQEIDKHRYELTRPEAIISNNNQRKSLTKDYPI